MIIGNNVASPFLVFHSRNSTAKGSEREASRGEKRRISRNRTTRLTPNSHRNSVRVKYLYSSSSSCSCRYYYFYSSASQRTLPSSTNCRRRAMKNLYANSFCPATTTPENRRRITRSSNLSGERWFCVLFFFPLLFSLRQEPPDQGIRNRRTREISEANK